MNPLAVAMQRSSFIIERLEVFNWGPFNGLHRIHVDRRGSAIIGQTGSGKTTLVDALMTLIAERPLYNLASTGGHESDRDLVSYIRGVSGEGDDSGGSDHIARPGNTITALSARFSDGEQAVTLGALFWLEGSSSSMTDLKRLWIFIKGIDQGVADWLSLHREGGARGLKQFLREHNAPAHDAKTAYLAQLHRFFEVGRNAFPLLNRAAGLKQLNSVDQLFRELVLEDKSAYRRAEDVVAGFDVLTEIHGELETARRQQQSLLPIAEEEKQRLKQAAEVQRLSQLKQILPAWFAGHACRLWEGRLDALGRDMETGEAKSRSLQQREKALEQRQDELHRVYVEAGGGDIEQLQQLIEGQREILAGREKNARDYLALVNAQGLETTIDAGAFERNRHRARQLHQGLQPRLAETEQVRDQCAGDAFNARQRVAELDHELSETLAHEDSNLPGKYLRFKRELVRELGIGPDEVAFVAELVEVKAEEQAWRGAIERALGGHRLRLIIPGPHMGRALSWVNRRDNRLHVRLLDAAKYREPARFLGDGFTHKLNFAPHPLREPLKRFLAEQDLHCVPDTATLRETPHALTREGTISGKSGRFDKQDQVALDQGWMTGFDNRDRVAQLQRQLEQRRGEARDKDKAHHDAKKAFDNLQQQSVLLEQLDGLRFEAVDTLSLQTKLKELKNRLDDLQREDSDTYRAKQDWEAAKQVLQGHREVMADHAGDLKVLVAERDRAQGRLGAARKRRGAGLSAQLSKLAEGYFPPPGAAAIDSLEELESDARTKLDRKFEHATQALNASEKRLIGLMGKAKKEDTGALAEAGIEIRDIPNYLQRLDVLTKEALPEKLERFLGYLNKSSDEGVTQLLTYIDNEVTVIEERIGELNGTLVEVDFEPGRYLQLEPRKVTHPALTEVFRARKSLRSAALEDDQGESHYRALIELVRLLRDAVERRKTTGARALLDPRYRLQFFVKVIAREGQKVIETRTGSQGGSGGEKEIIASYILTASLSYALCPTGMVRPLFGTVVLDEAFSKSSQAVAARIIEALRQFGLHPLFITPNKEMRLLRKHTRSAVLVHRRGRHAGTSSLSWEELDEQATRRLRHEIA